MATDHAAAVTAIEKIAKEKLGEHYKAFDQSVIMGGDDAIIVAEIGEGYIHPAFSVWWSDIEQHGPEAAFAKRTGRGAGHTA